MRKKEQAIWQRRFWEDLIRRDQDFIRHVEYIHYNPVKRGLAKAPKDWPYSSFQRHARDGVYEAQQTRCVKSEVESVVGNQ